MKHLNVKVCGPIVGSLNPTYNFSMLGQIIDFVLVLAITNHENISSKYLLISKSC